MIETISGVCDMINISKASADRCTNTFHIYFIKISPHALNITGSGPVSS